MRIITGFDRLFWFSLAAVFAAALFLAGCGASTPDVAPTPFPTSTNRPELVFTLPATWTPEPSQTPGPRHTATVTPTQTVTSTPLGLNNPYLTGVEALLPEGARPLRERAWRIGGEGPFWGYMILPVELVAGDGDNGSGQDVALLGLPRGESEGWDRTTIYLLWLWSNEKREPRQPVVWEEIRQLPYAPEQAERAFLARDAEGNWNIVPLNIAEEVSAGPLLRVDNEGDVFLATVEKLDGTLYILRDGARAAVYGEEARLWQDPTDRKGQLSVIENAPPSQVNGSGPTELMLHWSGDAGGTVQLLQRKGDAMALIAETSGRAQFLEIDGDGFREFLLPDDINSPTRWDVLRWDGERYVEAPALEKFDSPEAHVVTDWEKLPSLPASLYLRGADGRWAVWPEEGGPLFELTSEPPEPQPCTSGVPCRSPDGRYAITAVPGEPPPTRTPTPTAAVTGEGTVTLTPTATPVPETATADATEGTAPTGTPGTPEPSSTTAPTSAPTAVPLPRLVSAIRSSGRTVEIPGTLNYTGTASFDWDSSGLWMGWAGMTGGLYQVNPATGAAVPLLEASICSPVSGPCPQRSSGMGVISPRALPDGAIGFAVQSTVPGQYPQPGIYRRDPDGTLNLLADLRLLEPYCIATRGGFDFGQVLWSPDGEAFLYYSPPACLDGIVLLGQTDGSVLYDLSNLPGAVTDIRWGE